MRIYCVRLVGMYLLSAMLLLVAAATHVTAEEATKAEIDQLEKVVSGFCAFAQALGVPGAGQEIETLRKLTAKPPTEEVERLKAQIAQKQAEADKLKIERDQAQTDLAQAKATIADLKKWKQELRLLTPTPGEIAELLKAMGYQCTVEGNTVTAQHPDPITPDYIIEIGEDALQLATVLGGKGAPRQRVIEACSRTNKEFKRGRYYMDEDGDVVVDQVMEVGGGLLAGHFEQAMRLMNLEIMVAVAKHFADLGQ